MKKITLLVAGLLLGSTLAHASATVHAPEYSRLHNTPVDYRDAEPVLFTERGIEFMVFLDGSMDFNTVPATTGGNYYRGTRAQSYGYGSPGTATRYTRSNVGVRVEHDYAGRVRRVGNVFINYDAYGRVKRIGSVYMRYNSFALMQIGGMRFAYDRWGRIVRAYGFINSETYSYVYVPCSSNTYAEGNYTAGYGDDDALYYRRKDGTKAKMTEADIADIENDQE
ncbi:hypothetical protein CHU92_00510 [Flavobacterium cyanobacteriorum]|uniref:Uncharacterized protein n=1 Tax=Flavobacterium cyanobacteriorum TaxID=2022802 RepID=A0A256A5M5_9FLAO|nr:hypothetical protein [Flavobacterium cyanobacteriorum]OYQ49002.1 hypothetical protein CHU92_00510 [Flavobacterium cyanobacteriorum]